MGSRDQWFRRTSWSDEDQLEFERRLTRARPRSRPQYLRIQATHLAGTGDARLLQAAIGLADRVLSEYPDDLFVAWVHELRADAHERLGELALAVDSYRQAVNEERRRPNVRSNAWIGFGWLVISHQMDGLYCEAEALLEEFATELPFPASRYRFHAIRAIIAAHRGDSIQAKAEAELALSASAATYSGFRYHPDIGLVPAALDEIRLRLAALVRG